MKHIASVSKHSPAVAGISLGSLWGWQPGILGANELGDFVLWLTRLAEGVLNWNFLPSNVGKSGGDPE